LHLTGEAALDVLQCEWFERDGGVWHLTNAARQNVLEAPAAAVAAPE
jgi:hypothetical protein